MNRRRPEGVPYSDWLARQLAGDLNAEVSTQSSHLPP